LHDEGELLMRRALAGMEHVLGCEHPRTLGGVNNLAIALLARGNWTRWQRFLCGFALGPLVGALVLVVGAARAGCIVVAAGCAAAWWWGKRAYKGDEAELLFRRALASRERVLGPEHPSTLGSVDGLAMALLYRESRIQWFGKGAYEEAEQLSRRAVRELESKLGSEHPATRRARSLLVRLRFALIVNRVTGVRLGALIKLNELSF